MELKKSNKENITDDMSVQGIYKFKDTKMSPDPFQNYNTLSSLNKSGGKPVIVIDNGKYLNRVGINDVHGVFLS